MMSFRIAVLVGLVLLADTAFGRQEGTAPHNVGPSPPAPSFKVPSSGFLTPLPGTDHEVMILGLKPDRRYSVEVVGYDNAARRAGNSRPSIETTRIDLVKKLGFTTGAMETPEVIIHEKDLQRRDIVLGFDTGPLPQRFPPIEVVVRKPSRMSPGFTLFTTSNTANYDAYVIVVDALGEVVWYRPGRWRVGTRMMNGNLLLCRKTDVIQEVDMMGNVLREITNRDFGVPRVHHDCVETKDGHILTLGLDLRRDVGPYPGNNAVYNVVGDTLLELNWDGDIVNSISLHDVLDPLRVAQGFHNDAYDKLFAMKTKDWTHSNSIIRDDSDDSYIVSVRHQDAVIKVSREGELIWVLGQDHPATDGDDSWPFVRLLGSGHYPNHQHAADLTPHGDLIVYDNANDRQSARPVIYDLDEDKLTATQVFEYHDAGLAGGVCSLKVGDANYLPGDSILVTHGAMRVPAADCPDGVQQIRILEVDRFSREKLFEIVVKDPAGVDLQGYRAERLPTLYPEAASNTAR